MSGVNAIKLPACLLRAAAIFRAKDDARYYLNGIHINPAGFIESADGPTAFRGECEKATLLSEPLILDINGNIPKVADTTELVPISEDEGFLWFFKANGKLVQSNGFPIRLWTRIVTEGRFPDLGALIDKHEPAPAKRVQFNTSYLVRLEKAARAMGSPYSSAIFELAGERGAAAATIRAKGHTAKVLVTTMRP
ncbi:hypothetical protein [Microbulbifer sp. TYP-18]|uniref:hypothetical protein n=1 Tax=Microbulbifer sp. TYP-18 TaxID=3230024 RepID=UPI0034C6A2B8